MRASPRPVSWKRLALAGLVTASLVMLAGFGLERFRFGKDAAATTRRLVEEVQRTLAARERILRGVVAQLASQPELGAALYEGPDRARRLFELLERTGLARQAPDGAQAVTLYSADNQVLAWTGRPSTLPAGRLNSPGALFVMPGPLGLRLVYVASVTLEDGRRAGAVAAERVLSPAMGVTMSDNGDYTFETSLVPVVLVPRYVRSGESATLADVVLRGGDGEPLLEIRVDREEIVRARRDSRATTYALAALVLVGTLLLVGASVARWRLGSGDRRLVLGSLTLSLLFLVARWLLWWSVPPASLEDAVISGDALTGWWAPILLRSPLDILAHGLLCTGLVGVGITVVDWARLSSRTRRRALDGRAVTLVPFVAVQLAAGTIAAALVVGFAVVLRRVVEHAAVDVLHLSFHPYDYARLALLVGLVLLHAAVVWAAVTFMLAARVPWRINRAPAWWRLLLVACWSATTVLIASGGVLSGWNLPRGPLLLTVVSAGGLALAWRKGSSWFRHASQAGRVLVTMLALVVPSLLLYPSLADVAERARQQLVEERFATETLALPRTLLAHLDEARQQVDRLPGLADLLLPPQEPGLRTDTAFAVWRRTALGSHRLTSAVEMYDAGGRLVSRFALNLPEYEARNQQYRVTSCRWAVFGEAAPFGAEERRMLHAERGICDAADRVVGTLVMHVLPDYATLSFISSQNPYFEIFSGPHRAAREDLPGSDVGLVIYGWGRTALFTTIGRAWPLDDQLFNRLYRSNQGFWTTLSSAGVMSRVYFVSDRNGIYALAYAVPTWFDHSVHLAELVTLAALASVVGLLAASLLQRLAWHGTWTARQLLREVRTSFSRKLFLAFVAATTIPVLILAFTIRAYVASRLRHDVEAEAARTAAVAQRVIEETISIDRGAEIAPTLLDDDALVWISRLINQDVNVYDGPQLVATSERDLFASGQLPTRTPDRVYRAIAIDRLPSYVGEDELAGLRYLTAAAPVRAGNRDAVLTVPFTLRQREIEREIDELDRGVQLGALVFILLGAGVGFWLAERISDPVQRLTRASRRIAAGDLDTRVFVRSADELRRLVEAFNKMAWELQRQRAQLERTNRLEAWAEMARQVAHDIKNPLTPIQLSAEHLRRVHRDRGQPLTPVLDNCVDTILTQVRLLRQIAGEFSSFASTPVLRPVSTSVRELMEEVVHAYEPGLAGRVSLIIDVAPDVPDLQIDRTLVGRAITNIVENALHAMPARGTVTLQGRRQGDGAVITITDTGIGMDEEALGRIFEPYFSTKATGTGLGLTIAKRNIELHGGRISISSRRGAGTSVSFTLPAAPETVPA